MLLYLILIFIIIHIIFCLSQDYGMWERGDKTNQGITEINASSIGMAKVYTHTHTHMHVGMMARRLIMEKTSPVCGERAEAEQVQEVCGYHSDLCSLRCDL